MEIAFAWWSFDDPIIGTQYRPMCTVAIQKRNGKWKKHVFKVDSGADTMLMEECDCNLLGYTLNDCSDCMYTNANKDKIKTHIHNFNVRIGNFVINDVPISFSAKPIENLLLGRAKIFESLDICFDSETKHTLFASR